MHPWHDIPVDGASLAEACPAVIEIPRGSKNKYELDKKTGILRLDRVLHSAVHYPADYGFVPRTLSEDGDALDILVLSQEPCVPLTLLEARPIGTFAMRDEAGVDDKILSVSLHDPAFAHYRHTDDLPPHVLEQIRRFFQDYKQLENKQVVVDEIQGPKAALRILREALARYRDRLGAALGHGEAIAPAAPPAAPVSRRRSRGRT